VVLTKQIVPRWLAVVLLVLAATIGWGAFMSFIWRLPMLMVIVRVSLLTEFHSYGRRMALEIAPYVVGCMLAVANGLLFARVIPGRNAYWGAVPLSLIFLPFAIATHAPEFLWMQLRYPSWTLLCILAIAASRRRANQDRCDTCGRVRREGRGDRAGVAPGSPMGI